MQYTYRQKKNKQCAYGFFALASIHRYCVQKKTSHAEYLSVNVWRTFAIHIRTHTHIHIRFGHNTRSKWTIYRLDLYHYIDSVVLFSSLSLCVFFLSFKFDFVRGGAAHFAISSLSIFFYQKIKLVVMD